MRGYEQYHITALVERYTMLGQEVLEHSTVSWKVRPWHAALWGIYLGDLDLFYWFRQSAFGKQSARCFGRAKSHDQKDPIATLAGALRKNQQIPWCQGNKNDVRNSSSKKKEKGHLQSSQENLTVRIQGESVFNETTPLCLLCSQFCIQNLCMCIGKISFKITVRQT